MNKQEEMEIRTLLASVGHAHSINRRVPTRRGHSAKKGGGRNKMPDPYVAGEPPVSGRNKQPVEAHGGVDRYRGDAATSPAHYALFGGDREVLDLIEDRLSAEAYRGYCEGNAIKYLMRWRHKNGVEDLKKCRKYLDWLIEIAEAK